MKKNSAFWLLGMGSSGSTGSVVPVAPVLTGAFGVPGAVLVTWDPTLDDGGSPLTGYPIETSPDNKTWTQVAVADPNATSSQLASAVGVEVFVRVRAQSLVGKSDPSNVLSAIPTADYNSAEGGTVTQYTKDGKSFRVHTFKVDDNFVVTKAVNPFRVLAVGGGSGGGEGQPYCQVGARGASGEAIDKAAVNLVAGSFPVTVGGVAASSSFGSVSARGAANAGRIASDITGTSETYPGAGGADGPCRSDGTQRGGDGTFPGGEGGGGGGIGNESPFRPGPGGSGTPGLVVVSYEIAPFNDCEGGEVIEFEQGGKWYRTHTFKNNDALKVKTAVKPFRILAVGAGFGGGIGDYAQYGGGGGGVTDLSNVTLATGDNPVTIGMPSGGSTEMKSPSGTQVIFAQGAQGGNGIPGPGGGAGGPNNGGGGNGTQSDITGSAIWYAGGGGSVDWNYCCPARGGEGGLGGGGAWDCGRQNASYYGGGGGRVQHTCPNHGSGYQGVLIVRYEIERR